MADSSLQTSWAVCGIAAAAARFVPVPLLDDVVRERATRLAVTRTLRAHGRAADVDALAPLWGDPAQRGRFGRLLRKASTKVLLYPVRKYAAVFGAVKGVPNDVLRVVLLARTVDRVLARGGLAAGPQLAEEARAVRTAVDEAFGRTDLKLLLAGLGEALSRVRGLSAAAIGVSRRSPDVEALQAEAPVAAGAAEVTQVLRRPEAERELEQFDARVDVLLGRR